MSRNIKWVAGGIEAVLGMPIIGASIILGFVWTPLMIMLILHIVGLVFAGQEKRKKSGHILGIFASCLGIIPFIGMLLHMATAITLLMEASKGK